MAEEYKKSTSGWRTSLKNVAAEDSPENNAKKWNLFTSHEGSPMPIMADVTVIGTRTSTHGLAST